ncbi:MAG: hypothetical protein Q8S54_05245, partial [Bacteroidota bacterium]|nr:hypothetical protein [Bacteroidota bacterium]
HNFDRNKTLNATKKVAQLRPKRLAQLEPKWVAQLRPFYLGLLSEACNTKTEVAKSRLQPTIYKN